MVGGRGRPAVRPSIQPVSGGGGVIGERKSVVVVSGPADTSSRRVMRNEHDQLGQLGPRGTGRGQAVRMYTARIQATVAEVRPAPRDSERAHEVHGTQ